VVALEALYKEVDISESLMLNSTLPRKMTVG